MARWEQHGGSPDPRMHAAGAGPRGPRWGTMIGVWVLVFVAVWSLSLQLQSSAMYNPSAEPRQIEPRGDLLAEELVNIRLFQEASPSVVYITSTVYARSPFSFDIFKIPRGAGSGFVWDKDGYIVTNYHVVADAAQGGELEVRLADHSTWKARVVGFEDDKDLAVVKVDAPSDLLHPIRVGTSSDLLVGQKVYAIGNPFGWDQTLTTGVISALEREIASMVVEGRTIRDVIQTDAAINPGNSGGPLLDSAGRLIGVNTQIASPSGASSGVGFAVPVDTVNRIVPQLIRYGRVIRPGLGVQTTDILTRRLDLPGPLVVAVSPGSPAAQAGLRGVEFDRTGRRIERLGDVITKINGRPVSNTNELLNALEPYEVGDEVSVTYVRDGDEQTAKVKLERLESSGGFRPAG